MKAREMKEGTNSLEELKAQGHTLVGCFPLYPPLELFHSFGLTPLVLWGLRRDVSGLGLSDRHLQPYACGVARCLIEFILSHGRGLLDALFMYNACDTLRNLPEILERSLIQDGPALPIFRVHIPAVPLCRPYASDYLKQRIQGLVRELEEFTGKPFSPRSFLGSIALYRRQRLLSNDLERLAACGSASFAECAEVLMSGSRMPVEDHIAVLEHALGAAGNGASGPPNPRVMLSGILPPPRVVLETIESTGLTVAANDLAALTRSYAYHPGTTEDPGEYYEDLYRNHHPCTTILPSADRRVEVVMHTVRERNIKGLIFIGEKFCEYEYFEIPTLERVLKAEGVQTLFLEMSMDDVLLPDTHRTRIEAFAEMLRQETRYREGLR